MIGHPRRTSAILLCLAALILAAGVAVPARAADNAAPAMENAAGAPAAAPAPAPATPAVMNTGDTAWLLVSAALVMFMTPGSPCSTAEWSGGRTFWARSSSRSSSSG